MGVKYWWEKLLVNTSDWEFSSCSSIFLPLSRQAHPSSPQTAIICSHLVWLQKSPFLHFCHLSLLFSTLFLLWLHQVEEHPDAPAITMVSVGSLGHLLLSVQPTSCFSASAAVACSASLYPHIHIQRSELSQLYILCGCSSPGLGHRWCFFQGSTPPQIIGQQGMCNKLSMSDEWV